MSLLLKRRSRSETRAETMPAARSDRPRHGRAREQRQGMSMQHQQQMVQQQLRGSEPHLHKLGRGEQPGGEQLGGLRRRKTSAELISEAKSFLGDMPHLANASSIQHIGSVGGARLVSTRRPITPREPGRVLYGKVALAGRPPSAFSMCYLQAAESSHKPLTPPTATLRAAAELHNGNAHRDLLYKGTTPRQLPALHGSGHGMPALPPPTRNGALLTQSSTETLIELLKQHAGLKDCSVETVQHINAILSELYTRVRKQERSFRRAFILSGLYGLVECTAPRVLLAVARVVLALRVTGSNLTGACKLIFKVARHEQHDSLFHENDLLELLIDGLGHASPLDEPEACIYAYGSIRFLTASSVQERDDALNRNWAAGLDESVAPASPSPSKSPSPLQRAKPTANLEHGMRCQKWSRQYTLVERLAQHGAVELMILHLQMLNEAGAVRRLSGPPLHTLYQLSAALRALADVGLPHCDVAASASCMNMHLELACVHLIRAAEVSMGELEVQANVVRTLSVLSEDGNCCETLLNYAARIGMLLGPCADAALIGQPNERLLAVLNRLGYILGNILAKHEGARIQYYHNDVAMEYLLNVLDVCTRALLHTSQPGDTLFDVQVKLIRVVANMSVNAEVGCGLGNTRTLGAVLLQLLTTTSKALAKPTEQELLHATLGALHNLCFYQDKQTTPPADVLQAAGSLQSVIAELSTALCVALASCPLEATKVELARVLGNLTRNELARRCFCAAGGLPLIVQQLTRNPAAQDYELKTCAIGVLVNLLGDSEQRAPFLQLHGADVLTLLLRGALDQEDWFLATIVCQALWNLLIDAQCAVTLCSSSILDDVSDLLADHLDEERIPMGETAAAAQSESELYVDEAETELPDVLWEDFAVVATDLLERIQNNFDKQATCSLSDNSQERHNDNDDEDVFIEEM